MIIKNNWVKEKPIAGLNPHPYLNNYVQFVNNNLHSDI